MHFVFQESYPLGIDRIDPEAPTKRVKAKTRKSAYKQLPKPRKFRSWVLVEIQGGDKRDD